ncbi:MAG: cyclic nucleotide-binding domain-containing protein [Candidatus Competibacter sp.]|nr:cyclic nucleotide-binding domain-containing protein [Candidatus Competibacter sp.]MDG4585063.1 cyclic nucleotide-binding domain-containing protein [Candidatus Competibacter sp.]
MPLDPFRILGAALLAALAMTSLLIGVVIGLYGRPSRRTNAIIMAFGTGALIQALALELAFEGAERLIEEDHLSGLVSWCWVAAGFVAGGVLYSLGNRWLERYGAALRHPALTKLYLLRQKRERSADLLGRLARVDLLCSLPPEEMEEVLLCVQPVRVAAGETLFRQGDAGDALYLIDQGEVAVLVDSEPSTSTAPTAIPLARLAAGQSFGETALLTGEPRTATVTAITDVALLKIGKEHFDELLDESPRLRQAVETLNSQRLLQNIAALRERPDAAAWQKIALANVQRLSRKEQDALLANHAATGSPLALFLGATLDGIPASVVIGANFETLDAFRFTFLVAIFLSSVPEAIGSTLGMRQAGFGTRRIFTLWSLLVLAATLAGGLSSAFLVEASPVLLTVIGAIAGGGILAMVSSVMMPEAYEDGGPAVGLATIAGFLVAFLFAFV